MKSLRRERLLAWFLWLTCGFAIAATLAVLVLPLRGPNRLTAAAIAFTIAAACVAGLALVPHLERAPTLALYGLTALALTYGLLNLVALPMRLAVLGSCPPAPAACPPGLEPAMSVGETLAVEAGLTLGILALVLAVAAMETRFQPRLRIFGRGAEEQTIAPPPEMKASAIVKNPVGSDRQP